jgi:hypothetical protein
MVLLTASPTGIGNTYYFIKRVPARFMPPVGRAHIKESL